jgi:hypothetical protein
MNKEFGGQGVEIDIYSVEAKNHGNALILMRDISNLACLQSPNQKLIDENEYLREKLAAMEDAAKRKQELFQTLLGAKKRRVRSLILNS